MLQCLYFFKKVSLGGSLASRVLTRPAKRAGFVLQAVEKKTVERNKTEKNRGMFFGVLNRISPLNCEILVITYFQLPKSEVMICRNVYSRKPKKKKRKEKSDGK